MIKYWILVLFAITEIIECREDYRIHLINKDKGAISLSISRKKVGQESVFNLENGISKNNPVAYATIIEQINATGWGYLYVKTSKEYSDELQAYYAGAVEGTLTKKLIEAHWSNTYEGYCAKSSVSCKRLHQYLKDNFLSLVVKSRNSSGFLKMIRLHLWQIKGMQDGYDNRVLDNENYVNESYLLTMQHQLFQLYLLQADGDLSALSEIIGGSDYHQQFTKKYGISEGRCSALIKYVNGNIYSSHVTWNTYQTMLRLTKLYDFSFRVNSNEKSSPIVPGRVLSFSSYPAQTSSIDDFYITSAGLVTIETTIGNNNATLWKLLANKASEVVLEYVRVQAANRLATSGSQWTNLFATNNSGTYNNQWMIVNYNVMKNHKYGERIPDGALFVAEQIPTLVKSADMTDFLRTKSYWPSYNIPYFKEIWQLGGFQSSVDKYGDFADYNKSPRAQMFKRNASNVVDYVSLMRLMRYNNFKHDPLAKCKCNPPYSGENAISARCELNPKNGTYPFDLLGFRLHGGTDMKFTESYTASKMRFVAISGPTYDQQPVFDWRLINDSTVKHNLHPQTFRFPPILTPFT